MNYVYFDKSSKIHVKLLCQSSTHKAKICSLNLWICHWNPRISTESKNFPLHSPRVRSKKKKYFCEPSDTLCFLFNMLIIIWFVRCHKKQDRKDRVRTKRITLVWGAIRFIRHYWRYLCICEYMHLLPMDAWCLRPIKRILYFLGIIWIGLWNTIIQINISGIYAKIIGPQHTPGVRCIYLIFVRNHKVL